MKHPKGAVKTTKQMEKLLGKTVYLTMPPNSGTKIPRVSKLIVKLTPLGIELNIHKFHDRNRIEFGVHKFHDRSRFLLHTAEFVRAARDYAIATHGDWSVSWGNWADENMRNYFFANYWHAYAFTLQLRECV